MQQRTGSSAAFIKRWLENSAQAVHRHEQTLNALNLFPVADADTGTNLALTLDAGVEASQMISTSLVGEFLEICARHCLEQARGNSGTLLSVLLSGMAGPLAQDSRLTARGLGQALEHGRIRVLAALTDPQEGTILSVVSALARAAQSWPDPDEANRNLIALLEHLVQVGQEEVAASTEALEPLRGTGRVDSGALGLLIIMDCLLLTLSGEDYPGGDQRPYAEMLDPSHWTPTRGTRDAAPAEAPGAGVEFMCQMAVDPLSAARIRQELSECGDSVIMSAIGPARGEKMYWKVHVHVPQASVALSVLSPYGRPRQVRTEPLAESEPSRP